ncbi:hypothetical protein [Rubidibacter lacunae]|uniref:hypothetical protein n=1 Tax=Rubidibacter lacunae TaxID=582514 RepID=UPI00041C14D9|nr:hypothetical protein [Rubidibacter lacunae]
MLASPTSDRTGMRSPTDERRESDRDSYRKSCIQVNEIHRTVLVWVWLQEIGYRIRQPVDRLKQGLLSDY